VAGDMKPMLDFNGRRCGTVHDNGTEVRPCWGETPRVVQYYAPHGGPQQGHAKVLKAFAADADNGHYDCAVSFHMVTQSDDDGVYLTVTFQDESEVPFQFGWTSRD
jgi:hypothetical protein